MGLFDNLILEEKTSTATDSDTNLGGSFVSSQSQTSSASGGSKGDDGSFLIINDDNTSVVPEFSLDITSDDIPDTAISFATQTQDLQISEIKEESISFDNNEPLISFIENDSNSQDENENILVDSNSGNIDFFADSGLSKDSLGENNDYVLAQETLESPTTSIDNEQIINSSILETPDNLDISKVEVQNNEINMVASLDSDNINNFAIKQESVELIELDLAQIVAKSIENSQKFLDGQSKIKENLLKQIEDINKQIADLKTKAKQLTEETKVVNIEEEKAKKLIEAFKNYK